jgi:hypothetical protein
MLRRSFRFEVAKWGQTTDFWRRRPDEKPWFGPYCFKLQPENPDFVSALLGGCARGHGREGTRWSQRLRTNGVRSTFLKSQPDPVSDSQLQLQLQLMSSNRKDRAEISVMTLASRVIARPALLRSLGQPWRSIKQLRRQVTEAFDHAVSAARFVGKPQSLTLLTCAEVGEDGVRGGRVGDEGDDPHLAPTLGAQEREHFVGKRFSFGPLARASLRIVLVRCRPYLPVLTYWMQSPWFLNVEPSARVRDCQPSFLQALALPARLTLNRLTLSIARTGNSWITNQP